MISNNDIDLCSRQVKRLDAAGNGDVWHNMRFAAVERVTADRLGAVARWTR